LNEAGAEILLGRDADAMIEAASFFAADDVAMVNAGKVLAADFSFEGRNVSTGTGSDKREIVRSVEFLVAY
jgi:hypothetical protein